MHYLFEYFSGLTLLLLSFRDIDDIYVRAFVIVPQFFLQGLCF